MKRPTVVVVPAGRLQTAAALGLAATSAGIIAAASWRETEVAARLAIGSVVLFAIALLLGSRLLVGITTLPMLTAALAASAVGADTAWVQSIVVGSLWYVAAELGWDAIERRDRAERTAAFNNQRTQEVATVVALSLATTTAGFGFAFLAPTRGVVAVGLVILGIMTALTWATGHLGDSSV